ncbi:helix-turn-helix transcriptional regulator [Saccharothrix variisporea]|uniref:Regulatory LuxR family protein n=1 Tax=Saccharothrix variisporea TaxID=543527 RepID=A0A495XJ17_9PSEU|nr:LuxR family transcriptional regulator [Saccharothrix variisporea]RKT74067.1 regulatory LuxR family protein [Saccharothrix variisporea]
MLHGRDRQRVAVDAVLDRARAGRGGVLVLRGEPGSGKSSLLAYAADRYSAVLCVDDAHQLDVTDLVVLAREVADTRAAVLIATEGPPHGLPSVTLDPLDRAASLRVLHDRRPGLPAELAADLVDLACGNPLALVELAAALTSAELGGTAPAPTTLPSDSSLRTRLRARLDALSPAAVRAVAMAAVDDEVDADALLALGVDPRAVEEAGALLDQRRLIRSTLRTELSPTARHAAHAALADVLPAGPRRTWHRAAATPPAADRTPEDFAEQLFEAAQKARLRGDHVSAARDYGRAAALTGDPGLKAHRLVSAAADHWAMGAAHRSRAVLRVAERLTDDPDLRALTDLVRGGIELGDGLPDVAARRLVRAAEGLVGTRRALAIAALGFAGEAASIAGDHQRHAAIAEFAEAVRQPDEPPATRITLDHLVGMSATFAGRHDKALPHLRSVVELADRVPHPQTGIWGAQAAYVLGDAARAHELATGAVTAARESGLTALVSWALVYRALSALLLDQHAVALSAATEGAHAATALGQHNAVVDHLTILALLAAFRGDTDTALHNIDSANEQIVRRGLGRSGTFGAWAFACVDLVLDRPADALDRLRLKAAGVHAGIRVMAAPQVVEAAVGCGQPSTGDRALQRFEKWAGATRCMARMALSHRCHGLLTEGPQSDEHFREAIRLHRESGTAMELARTELLYGHRLRRDRKPRAARELLRDAVKIFQSYEADHWADRARAELRAAGETTAPVGQPADLTPQQARIARLVAEGATNREIAARLFLSHRTVEHHLRNMFTRLGVRSRVELTRMIG